MTCLSDKNLADMWHVWNLRMLHTCHMYVSKIKDENHVMVNIKTIKKTTLPKRPKYQPEKPKYHQAYQ